VGLLTILPVRAPHTVDRRRAGWAITLAPVIGLGIGVVAALVVFGFRVLLGQPRQSLLPPLAGLAVLALLTGALHLDGLADLADGFGARRDAEGTLAVMRDPAVGAFAVVTLVLVVAIQAAALAVAISHNHGTVALLVSVLTGRLAVVVACASGAPPARPEGLGALVAGSVPRARASVVVLLGVVVAVLAGRFDYHGGGSAESVQAVVAVLAGLLGAEGLRRLAVRKIGGLNGDVLGALVETATLVTLIAMAVPIPYRVR
jgi:adenosylcobinamide-GDP ribazoletransferase